MNIRTTLMLMAATVLPISAAPATTAELVKQLAVQEAGAAATPEQAAKACPALALLPKSVTNYVSVNIGALAAKVSDTARIEVFTEGGTTPGGEASFPIDHLAVGGKGGNSDFYSALNDVVNALVDSAAPAAAEGEADPFAAMKLNSALAEFSRQEIVPTYVAMTCKAGLEEQLAGVAKTPIQALLAPLPKCPAGFSSAGKVDWDKVLEGRAADPQVLAQLKKKPLYVMEKHEGNAIVLVFCPKTEGISLPASPAESVLATAGKDAVRKAGQEPLLSLHLSAQFMAASQKSTWGGMLEMVETMGASPEAAKSAAVVKKYLKGRAEAPVKHPLTLNLWQDAKGMSLDFSMDAQGTTYKPVPFRQLAMGDAASTIFYFESQPTVSDKKLPSLPAVLKAGVELLGAGGPAGAMPTGAADSDDDMEFEDEEEETIIETEDGPTIVTTTGSGSMGMEDTPMGGGAAQMGMAFAPKLVGPMEKFCKGMEGNVAIVIDGKGTMPEAAGMKGKVACPRLGIYAGVQKRELLAAAWDELVEAGALPSDLEIESKKAGKAMRYSIAHPLFNKDFMPNVMYMGKHAVFGTTPALNVEMLKAAGKGQELAAGAVFVFRPKPLAACLKSIDKASAPKKEPSLLDGSELAPAQAGPASQATSAVGKMAETIDAAYGMGTVEDGLYTIKVRIDFTRKKGAKE